MSFLLPGPASPMNPLHGLEHFDVYIVDQQSVCVPLLRLLTGTRVVFYCHFPDKLLSGGWIFGEDKVERTKGGLLNTIYRWPIDKLEEWTTGTFRCWVRVLMDRPIRCHTIQLFIHIQDLRQGIPLSSQTSTEGCIPLYRRQELPDQEHQGRRRQPSQIVCSIVSRL